VRTPGGCAEYSSVVAGKGRDGGDGFSNQCRSDCAVGVKANGGDVEVVNFFCDFREDPSDGASRRS
jgi:hypothetical protein